MYTPHFGDTTVCPSNQEDRGERLILDLREYLSVRRAYNLVRQAVPSDERLTFEEFAIVSHLGASAAPLKTSAIAEYQGALRPTMTHRTNHLESLGLIDRVAGEDDRRNVVCSISDSGREHALELAKLTCARIPSGRALSRTTPERILKYVDAMGAFYCKAGELVLLALLSMKDGSSTIMGLVDALGLLQPTVSMSVASLADDGLVVRERSASGGHTTRVSLTDAGSEEALDIEESIKRIVVRRKPRVS